MIGFSLGPVGRAVQHLVGGGISAPWAFVGAGAVTTITSGTSIVLPLHSPAQAGDFIVVQLSTAASLSAPQGTSVDAGTTGARYLTAVGGETSVAFTLNSALTATGIAVTFRPTSPGVRASSTSVTGNPATASSIAVSNLPSLITLSGAHNGNSTSDWVASLPAGSVPVAAVVSNAGGTVRALYFAYKIQTAGATTGTFSLQAAPTTVRATTGVFRLT